MQGRCLHKLAELRLRAGDVDVALELLEDALAKSSAAGDKDSEAKSLLNLGACGSAAGQTQVALDMFVRALPIFRGSKDMQGECICLYNMGANHAALGDLQKALNHFEWALELSHKTADKAMERAIIDQIGELSGKTADTKGRA